MSEIRLRNDTGQPLDDVRLTGVDEPLSTGPLPPGGESPWLPVPSAHRYPAVEATGPGVDLVHLPFEGAGQASLPEGRYTYVLRLEGGRLVVDLESEV